MENHSNLSIETQSIVLPDWEVMAFIATGVAHILLVILLLVIMGPTILRLLAANKILKNPISISYATILLLCVIGPSTYGFMMDISLISYQPVLGRCDRFAEHQVFWILATFFQGLLAWNTILISVTQFLVISRKRLVTLSGILAVITVLTVCAIPLALLNLSVVFANGMKVRGSLCTFIPDAEFIVFVIIFPIYFVVFYVTMVVFVVIFSVFVWRKAKQNVIETDAKVIRSVVLLHCSYDYNHISLQDSYSIAIYSSSGQQSCLQVLCNYFF